MMSNDTTPEETHVATAGQKRLLRVVYGMGIILVLLFMSLIGGIIWKATHKAPPPETLTLGLGLKAADVKAVAVGGGTIAITTTNELIVIDATRRKVLLREPLSP
jgi:hypothetical protein